MSVANLRLLLAVLISRQNMRAVPSLVFGRVRAVQNHPTVNMILMRWRTNIHWKNKKKSRMCGAVS